MKRCVRLPAGQSGTRTYQLIELSDGLIRRLQHMHLSNSDSVQWYRNAIAQALRAADALPEPLDFEK